MAKYLRLLSDNGGVILDLASFRTPSKTIAPSGGNLAQAIVTADWLNRAPWKGIWWSPLSTQVVRHKCRYVKNHVSAYYNKIFRSLTGMYFYQKSAPRWVPTCQGFNHFSGFLHHFSGFLHHFSLAKLANSSIKVKDHAQLDGLVGLEQHG